jgi:histidine triad (HIT) family protein
MDDLSFAFAKNADGDTLKQAATKIREVLVEHGHQEVN